MTQDNSEFVLTLDSMLDQSSIYDKKPVLIGGYGLKTGGKFLPNGAAPLLSDRQTPYPIEFSMSKAESLDWNLEDCLNRAGVDLSQRCIICIRGVLRSLASFVEYHLPEDLNFQVFKKGQLIYIKPMQSKSDENYDGPSGFGFNFEKTMTSRVPLLQRSYHRITRLDEFAGSVPVIVSGETDACDPQGRGVEIKSRINKRDASGVIHPMTKTSIRDCPDYDALFESIYYQMFFSNVSILKFGVIETLKKGKARVASISSWTLNEVAEKAFQGQHLHLVPQVLGKLKYVLGWIYDQLRDISQWEGILHCPSGDEEVALRLYQPGLHEGVLHSEIVSTLRELYANPT